MCIVGVRHGGSTAKRGQVRNHGWAGDLPLSDDEAIRRILDAARTCIEQRGGPVTISKVAREVGVTRQTVYRYFPTADDLVRSAILDASSEFLHAIDARFAGHSDLADLVVECVMFTVEELPSDPYLRLMLSPGRMGVLRDGLASPGAMALGRMILDRFPVAGPPGVTKEQRDELVEFM
jgi:AcrR family transcriptional regulator